MFAPYLVEWELWRDLLPIPLFAALLSLVIATFFPRKDAGYWMNFGLVFSFSLLGIVVGAITGLSRVSAVGAVLPGVLTLLGGVLAYLIGKSDLPHQVSAVGAVASLSISLLVGVFWGSELRVIAESRNQSLEYRLLLENQNYQIALQKLDYEMRLKKIRESLQVDQASGKSQASTTTKIYSSP